MSSVETYELVLILATIMSLRNMQMIPVIIVMCMTAGIGCNYEDRDRSV